MDPRTIQELCRYNAWANAEIVEVATRLTSEQFKRELGGSHPSVRATLTHMMWAEWLWLERWREGSPTDVFSPEDFPSVAVLSKRWSRIQSAQAHFVESLTAEHAQQVVQYANPRGETWGYPLWRQVYHLVNHSSYHRGQVTTQFRQLGVVPRTTDFLNFCDEVG